MKVDSLWAILVALRTQQEHLEISLEFENGQWLNVYASILPTSWTLQSVLLILETIVVAIVLFFIWSINRFSVPLNEFKNAAHRLGIDLKSTPIDIKGPKIVQDTAKAMNQMQHRIYELVRERTQMLAAMSHDLRTPITRLKLRLQLLEDAVTSKKMLKDLDEMEEMINETLSFAREDSRQEAKTKLDLRSLLEALCVDYADIGKNIHFIADEQRLLVFGRRLALKRAFSNIIDNALKYGTEATVSLQHTKNAVITLIEDNGPGVPEEELDKILQPFYRGEKSRSRDTGGTGLGLAVTKDIILAHHGSIDLSLGAEGGLCVVVTLPEA